MENNTKLSRLSAQFTPRNWLVTAKELTDEIAIAAKIPQATCLTLKPNIIRTPSFSTFQTT